MSQGNERSGRERISRDEQLRQAIYKSVSLLFDHGYASMFEKKGEGIYSIRFSRNHKEFLSGGGFQIDVGYTNFQEFAQYLHEKLDDGTEIDNVDLG